MSEENPNEIPHIPELIAEYDLIRELGRGGTAVVYLARDRELGRDVAIKLIRPAYVRDEDAVARLVREARTVGKLQHPSIVMLLGTRRLGDRGLALILQYVPGSTLKERIRADGPLPFDQVETILRDLSQALAYAHTHRIVHRDIKPENVYLDDSTGLARLADFGLARGWDSDSGLTMPGTAIGTPTYMSPEQIEGKDLDGRSDIYSLGLVGLEALTGRQPWAGESLYSIIYKQKYEDLPPVRKLRPGVPRNLAVAIEGATRKNPEERWRSAQEFLSAVEGEISSPPPKAVPSTPPPASDVLPNVSSVEAPGLVPSTVSGPPASTEPGGAVSGGPSARPPAPPKRRRHFVRTGLLLGAAAVATIIVAARAAPEGPVARFLGSIVSLADNLESSPVARSNAPTPPPPGGVGGTAESAFPSPGIASTDSLVSEGSGLLDPASRFPAIQPDSLLVIGGNEQVGVARGILPLPVGLRVLDDRQLGVSEVPVVFEVVSGNGRVEPASGVTGIDGSIYARWTLGAEAGEHIVRARTETSDPLEVVFSAEAIPLTAQRAEVLRGADQEGPAGDALPTPLELRILDGAAVPLAGIPVRFVVASGGGRVEPTEVVSDASGRAVTRWTLGPTRGLQEVTAEVGGRPVPGSTFRATAVPATLSVTPLVLVGGSHSCSLRSDGVMVCWGANVQGQLGDGSRTSRVLPNLEVQGNRFASAASGVSHVCALSLDGQAFCWGQNDQGQIGSTSPAQSSLPSAVTGSARFASLTAGLAHTCGLTPAGAALCWGANESAQLGDGTRTGRTFPVPVPASVAFRQIAAGWRHTCAVASDGAAYCWGDNSSGQLGTDSGGSPNPTPVQGGFRFVQLAAGGFHTCGLTTDGQVVCWGGNDNGQLGDGTTSSRSAPRPVSSTERFSAVAAGGVHSCALTENGAARCWGRNQYGQLGDGTTGDRATPTPVSGNDRFSQVEAVGSHTCGRTPTGAVLCWGWNLDGQLGDGSRENRLVPTPISSARP